MKGSIRTFFGLFLLIVAGSSTDNATTEQLPYILLLALIGAVIANSGVMAMKGLK